MAKTEAPAAPAFVSKPLSALPKREAPTREFDANAANALLGIVWTGEAIATDAAGGTVTASDGQGYADVKVARAKANAARRLLDHVRPDGTDIKTRVYSPEGADGTFEWAVYLAPHKERKPRKSNGTS